MTNHEKIKQMSVEEMAKMYCNLTVCGNCHVYDDIKTDKLCTDVLVAWLEQEADEYDL